MGDDRLGGDRGADAPAAAAARSAACATCRKALEACAFCGNDACAHAVCYPCLAETLRQSFVRPHSHGG